MTSGKRLLATSLLVSAIVLTLAEVQRNDSLPQADQYIGLTIAFFFLSAAGDLGAESFAGGFALLLLVTILLTRGDDALAYLLGKTKRGKKRGKAAQTYARERGAAVTASQPKTGVAPLLPIDVLSPLQTILDPIIDGGN